jgi:hypothetical protein
MPKRYIKASELKSFAFYERAWFLERRGIPSKAGQALVSGARDHRDHAAVARSVMTMGHLSNALLFLGLAGVISSIVWCLYR